MGDTPTRRNKSVRWTGSDEHRNIDDGGNEDYFTYPNASGNRPTRDDFDVSASDSDSSDDVASYDRRAATRANTWFNRLREDESEETDLLTDAGPSQPGPSESGPSRPIEGQPGPIRPQIPQIHVSEHSLNPYANLMDIGTKVSGGLAPGGRAAEEDDDPLDREYRERRDRLLASLGSASQPASPAHEIPDPLNAHAIRMSTVRPPSDEPSESSSDDEPPLEIMGSTRAKPTSEPPDAHSEGHSEPHSEGHSEPHSEGHSEPHNAGSPDPAPPPVAVVRKDSATQAEELRQRLDRDQSERAKRMEVLLERRKRRASPVHNRTPSNASSRHSTSSRHSQSSRHSISSRHSRESHISEQDSEDEELKRLEEQNRQDAELRAKLLVSSHLGGTTSRKKDNLEEAGYVPNLNMSLLDEDELPDVVGQTGEPHTEDHQTDSTTSSNTVVNEKADVKSQNSTEDTDTDSEDENRNISLRGDPDYVPPPKRVKEGVLGSLLRLYAGQEVEDDAKSTATSATTSPSVTPLHTPSDTPLHTPLPSPSLLEADQASLTPSHAKKWKRPGMFRSKSGDDSSHEFHRPKWMKRGQSHKADNASLSYLASSGLAAAGGVASEMAAAASDAQYDLKKRLSKDHDRLTGKFADETAYLRDKDAKKAARKAEREKKAKAKALKKERLAEQRRITVHIADVLQRQRFLIRLGRALMLFGAPSHRLEEYLKITSRVLEIDVQVLYIPGCLLFSFGDATTHTSETKLLKVTQGLNLQKLHSTHTIYKEVVHDLMGLEEASSHIDHLLRSHNVYPWYLVIVLYGLACACCGMFAYGALWRDIPIIFLVGGGVGFLQYWVQPKSDLYSNVFEVSSSIVVSFLGRAFGSIGNKKVFCFASIAQASIALILPGYIILTGALELQTKNLVAGSVRMFYANIYSLFLSFGITLGSAIYGWIDSDATNETDCTYIGTIDAKWKILFVPLATLFMGAVNQASPRQLPVMTFIGSAGYTAQYFVQKKVNNASSFTSAIGAFTLGVLGNLYSRVGHGLAFAAMLPGIFVLVPSGIAAQGSLVAGVNVANEIVNSTKSSEDSSSTSSTTQADAISELGNSMTQVAVGIVVGLFAATLVVYPLGLKKKRSGLFTF